MKIRIDSKLKDIAAVANYPANILSEKIADALIGSGAIESPENYIGYELAEAIKPNTPITTICEVLRGVGIDTPTCEHFQTLMDCTLFGNGECPNCGGECGVIGGEYRTSQTDYDAEPVTNIVWERLRCIECGYKFYN